MLHKKKFNAYLITFTLFLSILSFPIFNINAVADEDDLGGDSILDMVNYYRALIDPNDPLDPHPFRYAGIWESNKTVNITGDMEFHLYFSSTILTQLELEEYQDKINVSVYYLDDSGLVKELKNGNISYTLVPDLIENYIQDFSVKLKDIDQTVEKGDKLIFAIEVIQSEKPINEFIEERFETKIKNRVETLISLLKKTGDPDLEELAILIEEAMGELSNLSIGGNEFGALVNVLRSSTFYYGSKSYKSSVKFKTDEGDNKTFYFQHETDYTIVTDFGHIKVVNETTPTSKSDFTMPPISINPDDLTTPEIDEEEWTLWLAIWALYVFEEPLSPDQNKVTYYLHQNKIMDETKPKDETIQKLKLSSDPVKWVGPSFDRNKILKNVTADLYIYYPKTLIISTIVINATLKHKDKVIATDEQTLDRTNIIEKIKRGPDSPTRFVFEDISGEEIWHNKNLTLEVSVSSGPLFSIFTSVMINYDSTIYPSSITFRYEDTENIQLEEFDDQIVYAGGSVEYIFNVTSEHSDALDITVEEKELLGDWEFDYYPKSIKVSEKGEETIHVIVNSTAVDASAYNNGDYIDLFVNVSGQTGFDGNTTTVSVSEDAVEYDIEVVIPEGLRIKHGSSGNYSFIVRNKNKGFIADRYAIDIESENGLNLSYIPYIDYSLDVYDETQDENDEAIVNVTVFVPWYSDITTDKLIFEISSEDSGYVYNETFTVNTTIDAPNIFESIFQLFEQAANKIGLNNLSQKYAGWILIGILVIILLIIISLIRGIKKRKFVDLICLERIKEITPDETAVFEINVKNPYKYSLNYEIKAFTEKEKGFDVKLDATQMILEPKQSQKIMLHVKPTDDVKSEDWVEVKVKAKPTEKNKSVEISTITTIKDGKKEISISGVFHWPRTFKKGDRVETSFKLFNRGNVTANEVTVILYVNGEEKNKVEGITIPRGGHADINIPWIAVKGKNEIYITVK